MHHLYRVREMRSPGWASRAERVIPGGCSTGSKQPGSLFGSLSHVRDLPTHYERAEGAFLWATDGRRLLDLGMALGAVGLGYADPDVTRAVKAAVDAGTVSSLPHRLEAEVAERLVAAIPCAECVRFLRTGAEAGAAAVRLARAVTGRDAIVACGYFGWLDWSSDARGVPESTRRLVTRVPFDDCDALRAAVREGLASGAAPAAIVIEPLIHEVAGHEWLACARQVADECGAVLIFDEVKTAFRIRTGGVQEYCAVTPDVATVGKALANGFPLSAVVGRKSVMSAASDTWISSTAAAESSGLAAALAVLERHAREDVCGIMAANGGRLRDRVADFLRSHPWLGVRASGPEFMWRLESDDEQKLDRFVALSVQSGVLFKRGAYQFGSVAHDDFAFGVLCSALSDLSASLTDNERESS